VPIQTETARKRLEILSPVDADPLPAGFQVTRARCKSYHGAQVEPM